MAVVRSEDDDVPATLPVFAVPIPLALVDTELASRHPF
jgi:hypothetical protein